MRSFRGFKSEDFFKSESKAHANFHRGFNIMKGFVVLVFVAAAVGMVWFMTGGRERYKDSIRRDLESQGYAHVRFTGGWQDVGASSYVCGSEAQLITYRAMDENRETVHGTACCTVVGGCWYVWGVHRVGL